MPLPHLQSWEICGYAAEMTDVKLSNQPRRGPDWRNSAYRVLSSASGSSNWIRTGENCVGMGPRYESRNNPFKFFVFCWNSQAELSPARNCKGVFGRPTHS